MIHPEEDTEGGHLEELLAVARTFFIHHIPKLNLMEVNRVLPQLTD